MNIHILLREGGEWWSVNIPNADTLKDILNKGCYNGTQLVAVMIFVNQTSFIFDFILHKWR